MEGAYQGVDLLKTYSKYFEDFVVEQIGALRALTGHPIELYYYQALASSGAIPPKFDHNHANIHLYYQRMNDLPKTIGPYFKDEPKKLEFMLQNSTCFANV